MWVGVGLFVVAGVTWANARDRREALRRANDEDARFARAWHDVADTPFDEGLTSSIPRPLLTPLGRTREERARLNRILQRGRLARGVIVSVENRTDEEGLQADEVQFVFRHPSSGALVRATLSGDDWLYRHRPAWCRVRRPIAVLIDDDTGAMVVYEHVMEAVPK